MESCCCRLHSLGEFFDDGNSIKLLCAYSGRRKA
jgi:hypothetical protein